MPQRRRPRLNDPVGTDPAGHAVTVERQILAYVRQGAYPHVAAAAAGVDPATWAKWTDPHRTGYRSFQHKLSQATAQARVKAELAAFADKPLAWLKNGPGREQPENPGWSGIPKPVLTQQTQVNILASPEWNALWAQILRTLAAFPEARAALADALCAFDPTQPPPLQLPPPADPPA